MIFFKRDRSCIQKIRFSNKLSRGIFCVGLYAFVFFCMLLVGFNNTLNALDIDGRTSLQWLTPRQDFGATSNSARGVVKLKDGFEISGDTVTFDITESVESYMDLNDKTIVLNGPLNLAPNLELYRGGFVDGQGHTITLEGDLTIPYGESLIITSDTVLDGRGNTLYFDPYAVIAVENNATLTLRNMRIKNIFNDYSRPIIRPLGNQSQVALQDLELALGCDVNFFDGQLFIHDDVIVTGTSVFLYRSTQPCYICDAATLGFDKGSTFSYSPYSRDKHLIQMLSKTACMYLDGATLYASPAGIRLSNGMLCLDNNVTLSSYPERLITSFSGVTSKDQGADAVNAVDWIPSGTCLVIGTSVDPSTSETNITSGDELRVYSFNPSTGTLTGVTSVDQDSYTAQSVDAVSWSPGGNYLAVGSSYRSGFFDIVSGIIRVYRFALLRNAKMRNALMAYCLLR